MSFCISQTFCNTVLNCLLSWFKFFLLQKSFFKTFVSSSLLCFLLSSVFISCLKNPSQWYWKCRDFHARRQWHPIPVLLPGKSHGWRSLVGCSPWGRWVGHDWATSLSFLTFMHWRRQWQPTLALLPRESQGRQSPVGCRLWVRTELDTTVVT